MPAESESTTSANEIGPVTVNEESLGADAKRFRIVAIIAAVLLAPQAISHLIISFTVLPTFKQMFADMGGELPAITQVLLTLGPATGVLLVGIDVLIFWACYRLARKYWIGLLFAPLFAVGTLTALLVQVMYLPLFSIITLVE